MIWKAERPKAYKTWAEQKLKPISKHMSLACMPTNVIAYY